MGVTCVMRAARCVRGAKFPGFQGLTALWAFWGTSFRVQGGARGNRLFFWGGGFGGRAGGFNIPFGDNTAPKHGQKRLKGAAGIRPVFNFGSWMT